MFRTILFKRVLSLLVMGSFVYAHAQDITIDGMYFVKKEGIWYQRENNLDLRVGNEITIKFNQMPEGTDALQNFSTPKNLTLIRKNRLGYFDFQFPPSADPIEVLRDCKNDINVKSASLGTEIIFLSPNDTYFQDQWTLSKIQIENAWNIITGTSSVIITIIDDGIHVSHDDLSANIWQNDDPINGNDDDENGRVDDINGWNFHENSNQLNIDSGALSILTDHGTACAGNAAAATNNGEGIAGVAGGWNGNGCKIMGARALSSTQLDDAILYAADEGTVVISMSFGSSSSSAIDDAIESAYNAGVILVASVGNGNTQVGYPASNQYVFAVGATDDNDDRWDYSNYGSNLDVMAPSGDVSFGGILYSTDGPGNTGYNPDQTTNDLGDVDYTKYFGGTSGACPHVSGLAALIRSVDNSISNQTTRYIIKYTAKDLGSLNWDQYYGWGRINAYDALRSADRQFTTSGTLSYDECWWGTITITGNVTIPAGKRLTIVPGTVVKFNQNIKLYVKGTLRAYGESGNKITFKSSKSSPGKSDWKGIKFTDNGGGIVRHCIIKDCDDPIRCYFTAPDSIAYCEIDHCHDGLSFYKIYDPCYVVGNTIQNSDQRGVDISNSTKVELRQNNIYHNAYSGIKAYGSDFASNFKIIFNNVYDNNTSQSYYKAGIYAYNSTFYSVMDNNIYNNKKNGLRFYWYAGGEVRESSIYNNDIYEVYLSYDSYPFFTEAGEENGNNEIICGYYGSGSPPSSSDWAIYHGPDNLDYEIDAVGNDWGGDPSVAEDELFNQPDYVDYSGWLEKAVSNNPVAIYEQARSLFYEGQYESAINQLQQIIEDYPDSKITPVALRYIFYVVNATNGDMSFLYKVLQNFVINDHFKSAKAVNIAQVLAAQALWIMGDVEQATTEYQDLLSTCKEDAFRSHIMLNIIACKLETGLVEDAISWHEQLSSTYPESEEKELAQQLFDDYQEDDLPPVLPKKKFAMIKTPNVIAMTSCYPNPFNPETAVSFTLPNEQHVLIEVYNILGQKIIKLLDLKMPAGNHNIRWDGKNQFGEKVGAGIYLCRMRAGDFIKTHKMTLLP